MDATLSQSKNRVKHLGRDVFHDSDGHNTLTADISGSDLSHCWLEFSLDGDAFDELREFGLGDFEKPVTKSHDGVALDNISMREAIDIRWRDDNRETLQLYYGENGGSGEALYKAESSGDPTSFSNPTMIYEEPAGEEPKAEDPNLFWDRSDDTLYLFYEDGHDTEGHGWIGILEAETLDGDSWTNKQQIGGDKWSLDSIFASPTVFKINDVLYVSGEEHNDGAPGGDLIIAKGSDPQNWIVERFPARVDDYPEIAAHINLQGPSWYSKDGTLYSYTNTKWESDGAFRSAVFYTNEFDSASIPIDWQLGDRIDDYIISGLLRFVNDMFVYGYEPGANDRIVYWTLSGTRIDKPIDSNGGTVSFDWYEPTTPPDTSVEWRVAVEDNSGSVERTETMTFEIGSAGEQTVAKMGDVKLGDVTYGG